MRVFHPYLGIRCGGGGGGAPKGLVHNLLMQFFTVESSKIVFFEFCFFLYIVTTQNDHTRYANHVLGRICVFLTPFGGGGGGAPRGLGTQPAYAAFHPGQLKNGSFRNLFISYCHHLKLPSKLCKAYFRPYLHVLDPIWVLGWGGGGGAPKGLVHNLLMQFFTLDSSKMEVFETSSFDMVTT